MVDGQREVEPGEHRVSPLELFFDLVLVFGFTQVTRLLAADPTWGGLLRGMLVLGALWFAWNAYAWLTSATDVDEGGVRLAMLASMGAMLVTALAVPGAFADDALLFGVGYFVVRFLHLVLSAIVARGDPDPWGAIVRFAPTAIVGSSLLVVAAFFDGGARIAIWVVALAIDYLGPVVFGMGRGWRIAAEHFAERYGLIVLIALGESIIAIGSGIGAGAHLDAGTIVPVALGVVLVSALWWLYFDVAAIFARTRLMEAVGLERARLARDSYAYLHLPMVAGIVLLAFGIETTLHQIGQPLDIVAAVALCGGTALYLVAHIAFLFRATHYLFRRRTLGAAVLLAAIPVAGTVPALVSLALVTAVCSAVVAYEAIRHRAGRTRIRHPEVAA
jgi:low temperature requirement protein LtrA